MKTIAIDLGGTNIKIALISEDIILQKLTLPAYSGIGLKPRLDDVRDSVNRLLAKFKIQQNELQGIGIAFPGLVDIQQKKIISTNKKYDDAMGIDLEGWVKTNWNLTLTMDNDARMALRGTWQYGAGKGIDNLVMVTLGTGFGGAALVNGKILYGKHYQAGCLGGHFTINFQGGSCTCGNIGCVESEAAGWSLPRVIKNHPDFNQSPFKDIAELDFEVLFELVRKNDAVAKDIMKHCLDAWSAGIISMIHAYDPEMVIISGGIMKSGDLIVPYIQEKVIKHAWTPWGKVIVKQALHINEAVLLGANYMVEQLK